jgi:hypothetical protein
LLLAVERSPQWRRQPKESSHDETPHNPHPYRPIFGRSLNGCRRGLRSSPHRERRVGHRSLRRLHSHKRGRIRGCVLWLQRWRIQQINLAVPSPARSCRERATAAAEARNCYARRAGIERPHFARIARSARPNSSPRGIVHLKKGQHAHAVKSANERRLPRARSSVKASWWVCRCLVAQSQAVASCGHV